MSSKSKDTAAIVPEQEEVVAPIPAPDPTPTNVATDISKQMVTDKQKTKKGRSWSLLTRSGSDSRRTMLSSAQTLG